MRKFSLVFRIEFINDNTFSLKDKKSDIGTLRKQYNKAKKSLFAARSQYHFSHKATMLFNSDLN